MQIVKIGKSGAGSYFGREVTLWTLENESLQIGITDLGASIQFIRFKTPEGFRDLCLGYASQAERIQSGSYCGAVIGRVSNRIAGASYELNGKIYHLSQNDGNNTLHGGAESFDTRFFDGSLENGALAMRLISPDGDQGFGGTLALAATFRLEKNELCVQFSAVSDADTVWAPTIHPYFNFGARDILGTILQIHADEYTPMNEEQISTGEIVPVEGSVFDFRMPKMIGKDISNAALGDTRGYDHNFVLRGEHAATVFHADGGVKMDIYTDLPGLHFYSGNHLKGYNGHRECRPYEGFALEPQFFPDSVNQPNFETPVLRAGEIKKHYIRYTFHSSN